MRTISSFFIGMFALLLTALSAGEASAAPRRGWTPISSDYATNSDTPAFSGCYVSQSLTSIKMKVRAKRPNSRAVSIVASWNSKQDFSGTGSSVRSETWSSGMATVTMTLPKANYLVLSWQTNAAGFGYTGAKQPPVTLARCP